MIQKLEIINKKLVGFNEDNNIVGALDVYERLDYSETNSFQRHTVKVKNNAAPQSVQVPGSIIIDKTSEGNPAFCKNKKGVMINTFNQENGNHFRVEPFSKNKLYSTNSVFAYNMEIFYTNEDNVIEDRPTVIGQVDMDNASSISIDSIYAKNIKSISDSIVIYDKFNRVYIEDSSKNSKKDIGVLRSDTISYTVIKGDKLIQVSLVNEDNNLPPDNPSNPEPVGPQYRIIVDDDDFPEIDFTPKSIAATKEELFIFTLDKKLYSSKIGKYDFKLVADYTGTNIQDIHSVYKDLYLFRLSSNEYVVKSRFNDNDSSTFQLDSQTRTVGLYKGYNVILSTRSDNTGGQKLAKIDKKFTHLTPSEYYSINGRNQVYAIIRSFNSTRESSITSNALKGDSLAISPEIIYIIDKGRVYEVDIPNNGLSDINNNTSRTESPYINYSIGYDKIYYKNNYIYMFSTDSRIIKKYEDGVFNEELVDLSDKINGDGIQSLFVSNGGEELTLLTTDGTVYVVNTGSEEVISTFELDGRINETEIFNGFRTKVLASNLYNTSKAIYEIDKSSGKRREDATLIVQGLSSYSFEMVEYLDDLVVYYGEAGRIDIYSRYDKVRRVK